VVKIVNHPQVQAWHQHFLYCFNVKGILCVKLKAILENLRGTCLCLIHCTAFSSSFLFLYTQWYHWCNELLYSFLDCHPIEWSCQLCMLQKLRSFTIFPTQMEGAVEATLENVAVKKKKRNWSTVSLLLWRDQVTALANKPFCENSNSTLP
jgi:hypothetical protein